MSSGTAQLAAGQSPADSPHQSSATSALPQPLVSANFRAPARAIDWSEYQWNEECQAAFARMKAMVKYQAFSVGVTTQRGTDTVHWDDAFPLDSTVVQLPRACLLRFRPTDVPVNFLPKMLQVAIAMNADSLIGDILAKQLAVLPATAVQARGALLEAMITDLLKGSGDGITTPAHVRMARAYLAQLDALGPTLWHERIDLRSKLIEYDAKQVHDLDAQLAILQEGLQLLQQPQVQQLPDYQAKNARTGMSMGEEVMQMVRNDIREVHYYQTFSMDTLALITAARDTVFKRRGLTPTWPGHSAPALHCDYYFPTPEATTPLVGSSPTLPLQGQLSLVVFYRRSIYYDQDNLLTTLRRIHRDLPTLPMTFVGNTEGMFGTLSGVNVVEDPTQEAVLLHHEIVDSLGFAGALCVARSSLKRSPEGHAVALSSVNALAYHVGDDYWHVYIVGPTGIVMGHRDFSWATGPGALQGGTDFEWYLKRLAEKYASAGSAHQGQ